VEKNSSYIVYNAAAGSGKTYTLVRDYLQILFTHTDSYYFRYVLAITFTNKAATEMKERVMQTLKDFASNDKNEMKSDIMALTTLNSQTFQKKAKAILESVLDDYSSFNITTIDSFTHRLMRTFAIDFGLSPDFNVELDADKVLQQAVDLVVAKIGLDEKLTKTLIEFSLKQSDDDKAWDISKNLFEFSKILLNETDKIEFHTFLDKSFEDFSTLQKKIKSDIKDKTIKMIEIGEKGLKIITEAGLQPTDFLRSQFPNHFANLAYNLEKCSFFDQSTLKRNVEDHIFYAKKTPQSVVDAIEQLVPQLIELYEKSEVIYSQLSIRKIWDEGLFPMMLLNYIFLTLENVKTEENIQFISDFNEKISAKVKNEPAPYIYERLGEKFKHYFIDEMQDTSVLQWNNLISLIDNALSQENGSLLLVGDAKQSIYRWRGSKPEQFISLSQSDNNEPYKIKKEVKNLDVNYRSFNEIVNFNNEFFSHISDVLHENSYQNLYKNTVIQQENPKKGGLVQIEFVKRNQFNDTDEEEVQDPIFPKKVLETIQSLDSDFQWKDVCVLVRTNAQGNAVAQYLIQNGIEIISSENLLLNQNPKIVFIVDLLKLLYYPQDKNIRFDVLHYLHNELQVHLSQHQFFSQLIDLDSTDFYIKLAEYQLYFNPKRFYQNTIYDGFEYLIRSFNINREPDIYLVQFAEFLFDYQIQKGSDLAGFLDYWEQKKEKISVSMPEGKNAVRIMSIHKSKGLQFPIVIYPYDLNLYKSIQPKVWYHFSEDQPLEGFDKLMIPHKSELQYSDTIGTSLYHGFRHQLELDNINLLYVTMTRAVEQLYIITDFGLSSKGELKMNYFSGLFTRFLQHNGIWDDEKLMYSFGNKAKVRLEKVVSPEKEPYATYPVFDTYISTDYSEHNLAYYTQNSKMWDTEQGKAIHFGNVTHAILAQIISSDEMPIVLRQFEQSGTISSKEMYVLENYITKLMQHQVLKKYFEPQFKVLCEKEIFVPGQSNLIPDRIVFFNEHQVGILDYKTGNPMREHEQQIQKYAEVLKEMGLEVVEKWLVYLGEEIELR